MGITTLMFCLVGFVSTLIFTLAVRIGHGATWRDLIRNRCYEVVPLRGLFWIALGLAWALFLTDVALFGLRTLTLIFGDQRPPGLIVTLLVAWAVDLDRPDWRQAQ